MNHFRLPKLIHIYCAVLFQMGSVWQHPFCVQRKSDKWRRGREGHLALVVAGGGLLPPQTNSYQEFASC